MGAGNNTYGHVSLRLARCPESMVRFTGSLDAAENGVVILTMMNDGLSGYRVFLVEVRVVLTDTG